MRNARFEELFCSHFGESDLYGQEDHLKMAADFWNAAVDECQRAIAPEPFADIRDCCDENNKGADQLMEAVRVTIE